MKVMMSRRDIVVGGICSASLVSCSPRTVVFAAKLVARTGAKLCKSPCRAALKASWAKTKDFVASVETIDFLKDAVVTIVKSTDWARVLFSSDRPLSKTANLGRTLIRVRNLETGKVEAERYGTTLTLPKGWNGTYDAQVPELTTPGPKQLEFACNLGEFNAGNALAVPSDLYERLG